MPSVPALILKIVGTRPPPGSRLQAEFHGCGGSIGRSVDCDWVLSAPGISRTHAVVRHLNGLYFIEDRSSNGMLLNGAPLVRGEPAALGDGDRLKLDSVEVEVFLRDASSAVSAVPTEAVPSSVETRRSSVVRGDDGSARAGLLEGLWGQPEEVVDPLQLFNAPDSPAAPLVADSGWDHAPPATVHFRAPQVEAPPVLLPERWDLTVGDFGKPVGPAVVLAEPPVASTPVHPEPSLPPVSAIEARARGPASAQVVPDAERIFAIVVDGERRRARHAWRCQGEDGERQRGAQGSAQGRRGHGMRCTPCVVEEAASDGSAHGGRSARRAAAVRRPA